MFSNYHRGGASYRDDGFMVVHGESPQQRQLEAVIQWTSGVGAAVWVGGVSAILHGTVLHLKWRCAESIRDAIGERERVIQ